MPKILIVDDDDTMVSLLCTLLELDGYEVIASQEWDGILGVLEKEQPELVLMDCILPQSSGLDILGKIRSQSEFDQTAVIMTSGLDMEHRCQALGANGFLLKPYPPEQLLNLIGEHI
ncbi:MAG: response regulator [Anaerolineales bacterium]|jgi:two-component system phosphate regulon response regulator PhoB